MISHFCFCCNLKYGFYTYGIIIGLIRFSITPLAVYSFAPIFILGMSVSAWCFITSAVTFLALRGIYQNKSMLIYPSLVVACFEIPLTIAVGIYAMVEVSAWFIFYILVFGAINVYYLIVGISLHQEIKRDEDAKQVDMFPLINNV